MDGLTIGVEKHGQAATWASRRIGGYLYKYFRMQQYDDLYV